MNPESISEFQQSGGMFGTDLYSLTMFNYRDDFADIGADSEVRRLLGEFSDFDSVATYLKVEPYKISHNKVVAAVILNGRSGHVFTYYAGRDIHGFSPDLDTLINTGIVDQDQVPALSRVLESGQEWQESVAKVDWKSGYAAPNDDVYCSLSGLLAALNLNEVSSNDVRLGTRGVESAQRIQASLTARVGKLAEKYAVEIEHYHANLSGLKLDDATRALSVDELERRVRNYVVDKMFMDKFSRENNLLSFEVLALASEPVKISADHKFAQRFIQQLLA